MLKRGINKLCSLTLGVFLSHIQSATFSTYHVSTNRVKFVAKIFAGGVMQGQFEYDPSRQSCSDSSIKQKDLTTSLQNRKCRHFSGELVIAEDDDVTEAVVEELESVTGCIHMVDTNVVKANFSSLKSLVYNKGDCLTDYALLMIGNDNLEEVIFHNEFKVDSNRVYIRANKKLKHERISPNGEQFNIGTPEECSRKEVLINENCTAVIGWVKYASVYDVIERINRIEGQLVVEDTFLRDLNSLIGKTIIGLQSPALWVRKTRLVNANALIKMQIHAPEYPLVKLENTKPLCGFPYVQERILELVKPDTVKFNSNCCEMI
ncbi:receptor L domain protein [Dictyocaulus viviparus]|uniref:Receptor L domain protein n=1 Tax=Dictyocaulus viviparus TaxID=29172 RepID=A0A0D8YC06_DICVI|nr:receptor L domain protein [Dictyocaulus viviparus]